MIASMFSLRNARSEGSESMEGMIVSPGYFKVVGLEAILGRPSAGW
jgi:hypothetical protein